jgi:hypothetical protein
MTSTTTTITTMMSGRDYCHAPNAKQHRQDGHKRDSFIMAQPDLVVPAPLGASVGVSPLWGPNVFGYGLPLWLVCRPGWGGRGIGFTGFGLWGFSQADVVRWSATSG